MRFRIWQLNLFSVVLLVMVNILWSSVLIYKSTLNVKPKGVCKDTLHLF